MSTIKVSDYLAQALFQKGVRHVFELSGGMITFLLDSLCVRNEIQVISVRHEQAAAFAADAYGRMTGVPGIAMATSGPGATNLLTGIGSCYFDSSPAVFITGQVNRHEQKKDRAIRQLGFQETDIVSMAKPITKAAWLVENAEDFPDLLDRAFELAVSGRPGPVLLDLPMDIQRIKIDGRESRPAQPVLDSLGATLDSDLEEVVRAIRAAKRPMLLVGGGVRGSRMTEALRRTVKSAGVPVVHSLMAIDALPSTEPLRVGMIGSYGNRWANIALSECDVLLVIGSRLDVRQTGSETAAFKGDRTIFHIDCEPGEINNRVQGCEPIVADLRLAIPALERAFANAEPAGERYDNWLGSIAALRAQWPDTAELRDVPGINPNAFLHRLAAASSDAAAYVVDVGQHQMWAAQSLDIGEDQRFLTSGSMGSMGFALPAALGAAMSAGGRPVVVIAGDGGLQCNIQELQTIAHHKLPMKIVVLNNRCHGMVRQFQESYFEGRYQSTYWGYSAPDFAKIANAYEICGTTVDDPQKLEPSLEWLWSEPDRPMLLQVMIDLHANAYPKIAFGKPISEMEPFSKPVAMEST
jgi:acetolactate synthase-1/2/3 large subunit